MHERCVRCAGVVRSALVADADAMNFDETLHALHGLVGRSVAISVAGQHDVGIAALLRGTLGAGEQLDAAPDRDVEVMFVNLEGNPDVGFFLHEEDFLEGRWEDGKQLELHWPSVEIVLEREDE
jgi:hypothetical protein